jgi:hypothetical protein
MPLMTFQGVGVKVKGHEFTTFMKWTNIFKTVNILYTDIPYSILGIDLSNTLNDLSNTLDDLSRS